MSIDTDKTNAWYPSRATALQRLDEFLPSAGRVYASSRNHDFGAGNHANVSCLSPWIRHRILLEEEVVRKTLARHSLSGAEKFIQEVFWRAYFKGWLEQRPEVWSAYRTDLKKALDQIDSSSGLRTAYESAIAGDTGIDCFDTWATELVETGYLHNHARMWFASIWIFTLRLPWQLGADFLYRHLLDGDPASNTLSWRWVGGLHTKGKNYVARASNIEKFTDGRFSPSKLAIQPMPLSEDREYTLQPVSLPQNVPQDVPFGLIITEEDFNAETLPLPHHPVGICGMRITHERSPLTIGEPANSFAEQAMTEALQRAQNHYQQESVLMQDDDWGAGLADWARELGVTTLVTAYTPVGPVDEKLNEAQVSLDGAGIELVRVRRPYDSACWPHATRGFFKLKEKIPKVIAELGLV